MNHAVRGLPVNAYFAMGVALPDMWSRFSRTQRIRWAVVRSAAAEDGAPRGELRAGLLNHVDADRWFHNLPEFLRWQREVRIDLAARDVADHPAVLDFLAHVALELALDSRLLALDAGLADRFYAALDACDPDVVETAAGELAGVSTAGLARFVRGFQRRRFLTRYAEAEHLVRMLRLIFAKTRLRICPAETVLGEAVESALARADPAVLWSA